MPSIEHRIEKDGLGSASHFQLLEFKLATQGLERARQDSALLHAIPNDFSIYDLLMQECSAAWEKLPHPEERLQFLTEVVLDKWRALDIEKGADQHNPWMDYRNNTYQIEQARSHASILDFLLRVASIQTNRGQSASHRENLSLLVEKRKVSDSLQITVHGASIKEQKELPTEVAAPKLQVPHKPSLARRVAALAGAIGLVALAFFSPLKSKKQVASNAPLPNIIPSGQLLTPPILQPDSLLSLQEVTRAEKEVPKTHTNRAAHHHSHDNARQHQRHKKLHAQLMDYPSASPDSVPANIDSTTSVDTALSSAFDSQSPGGESPASNFDDLPLATDISFGSATFAKLKIGGGTGFESNFLMGEEGTGGAFLARSIPIRLGSDLGGRMDVGGAIHRDERRTVTIKPAINFNLGISRPLASGFEFGSNLNLRHWPEIENENGRLQANWEDHASLTGRITKWFNSRLRVNSVAEVEYHDEDLHMRGGHLEAFDYIPVIKQPEVPNDLTLEPYAGAYQSWTSPKRYRQGIGAGLLLKARHKNTFFEAQFGSENDLRRNEWEHHLLEKTELRQQLTRSMGIFVEHESQPADGSGFFEHRTETTGNSGWRFGIKINK